MTCLSPGCLVTGKIALLLFLAALFAGPCGATPPNGSMHTASVNRAVATITNQNPRGAAIPASLEGATSAEMLDATPELEPGSNAPLQPVWQGFQQPQRPSVSRSASGLVTNLFYETDLRSALSDIAQQTGNIIVPDMSVQGVVTAELNDVTLEKALDIVLAPGGYIYKKMDGFTLVTSPDPDSPSFHEIAETRLIRLHYMDTAKARDLFADSMSKYIKADADSRMLMVTAPPKLAARIVDILQSMDHAPRQVLLDVLVVVLEEGQLSNMGLQWRFPQALAGTYSNNEQHSSAGRTGGTWPWGVQVGYTTGREFTDSLITSINLLAQNDEATVLASPQVMAQEGKEAEVNVSTEEYFEVLTQGFYTNAQLEKIDAGTILKITPLLGENGDITLDMSAEVSDVVARGENNLPVVTRRTAKSTVRVQDGGTAAMAGLIDNRSRTGHEHVPGLGKIPLVGRAFRNDSKNNTTRQVAIFVTPRLIENGHPSGMKPVERAVYRPAGEGFRDELMRSLKANPKGGSR